MNYNTNLEKIQLTNSENFIEVPCSLIGFHNTDTVVNKENENLIYINGVLNITENDFKCEKCGHRMHINNSFHVVLKHLNIGSRKSYICFKKHQFYCEHCHYSKMQKVLFQTEGHRITKELETYIKDLLKYGYNNKEVSQITGVGKNIVKDIDLKRLKEKYTENNKLIKPEKQAKFLGIDEFKLHNGHIYATHIIDLETGHILWIQRGKDKKVVYDFIKHVGLEWMKEVIAVACDMNANYEKAFKEMCNHIEIVFDHFHVVKNFNENVISKVRNDEYKRLIKEGKHEEAKSLKKSKYILTSSKETLKKKDELALTGKTITKSEIFNTFDKLPKYGYEERYQKIIKDNELLLVADIIKEKIREAYTRDTVEEMTEDLIDIIILCTETKNKHFIWFSNLIINHYSGIVTHAKYKISTGKIEGINNKIKTLRRQAYGYPDDEYFFLKLFDMSRN